MKSCTLLLLALLPCLLLSQTIRDYYLPESKFNKVDYLNFDPFSNTLQTFCYAKSGDKYNVYTVLKDDDKIVNIESYLIEFSENEALALKKYNKSYYFNSIDSIIYNEPKRLLTLPKPNQKITWIDYNKEGDDHISVSWVNENVNGVKKRVLKKTIFQTSNLLIIEEFYVKGIGLWKSEAYYSDGRHMRTLCEANKLSFNTAIQEAIKFN